MFLPHQVSVVPHWTSRSLKRSRLQVVEQTTDASAGKLTFSQRLFSLVIILKSFGVYTVAINLRILCLLLAGLQCSLVMADTIMIDDFSTPFTFGSGHIATADNGSNFDYANAVANLYTPVSPTTNTATWQDPGGATSGFVGTSRKAVFQISSDFDESGTVSISNGALSFNTSALATLDSLKLIYEGMPQGKIDLANMSFFLINFKDPFAGSGSNLLVALSLTDASATTTAFLSNANLVNGDNVFDFRGTSLASINMSQVTKIAVNLSNSDLGNEFTIRNFSFSPVPESGAGILVGAVLSGLVVARRWRYRCGCSPVQTAAQS